MTMFEFITIIGSAGTVLALLYGYLRNFKEDINKRFDKLETRIDSLDERMFYLSTGRTLAEAIKAEKMKLEHK